MGYESSASKRKLPRAGTHSAKKLHSLRSADIKLSDARADPGQSTRNNKTLLTTKRQLRNALALAQQKSPFNPAANEFKDQKAATAPSVRGKEILLTTKRQLQNALALAQKSCPVTAKTNKPKKRKTANRAGAGKSGRRSGKCINVTSIDTKADETLTLNNGGNVEASALYIIKGSPGKGLGMFAAKDIPKGTRILAETPFFTLAKSPKLSWSDPNTSNDISQEFDRLPAGEQIKFMGLHCPKRTDCSILISIYEANCYEMGSGACICLDAARINHSCVPNAHYSWNDSTKRITVHAIKDTFKGEEITISYCSAIQTLQERKRKLKPYFFTCHCPACQDDTVFGSMSQIRRQQMLDLDQEIADYQHDLPTARAVYGHYDEHYATQKILGLLDKEGLFYEKSLAYHDAAQWALKHGLKMEALEYASKQLNVDLCCVGHDSPFYEATRSFFLGIYLGTDRV